MEPIKNNNNNNNNIESGEKEYDFGTLKKPPKKLNRHEKFLKKIHKIGVKSGDLGFTNSSSVGSNLLQKLSHCPFSHCFLFLEKDGKMYVLESNYWNENEEVIDYIDNKTKQGISMCLLDKRLTVLENGYSLGIRKLTKPLTKEQNDFLFKLYKINHHKLFEQNKFEMLYSFYDGPFGKNKEDLSSFFCSEWVVYCLKGLNFLHTNRPCNEFTPGDVFRIQTNDIENPNPWFYQNEIHVIKK